MSSANSCCPEGLVLLNNSHGKHLENDMLREKSKGDVICYNSSSSQEVQNVCTNGSYIELGEDFYELRNENGNVVVGYFGIDPNKQIKWRRKDNFDLNSKFYCVSKKCMLQNNVINGSIILYRSKQHSLKI